MKQSVSGLVLVFGLLCACQRPAISGAASGYRKWLSSRDAKCQLPASDPTANRDLSADNNTILAAWANAAQVDTTFACQQEQRNEQAQSGTRTALEHGSTPQAKP